jgi:anti-anti-sigma factor
MPILLYLDLRGFVMKITSKKMNRLVLIKVEGSLITEQLKQLEKEIYTALDKDNNIVIDFNELSFICSAGLSLLIAFHKKAETKGLKLVITGCSDDILKLFSLTELDQHLNIVNSIEEAKSLINAVK